MRIFCFVVFLGISSTGCSGCDDDEHRSQEKLETPTTPLNNKRMLVSPALRRAFEDAGATDTGAGP